MMLIREKLWIPFLVFTFFLTSSVVSASVPVIGLFHVKAKFKDGSSTEFYINRFSKLKGTDTFSVGPYALTWQVSETDEIPVLKIKLKKTWESALNLNLPITYYEGREYDGDFTNTDRYFDRLWLQYEIRRP